MLGNSVLQVDTFGSKVPAGNLTAVPPSSRAVQGPPQDGRPGTQGKEGAVRGRATQDGVIVAFSPNAEAEAAQSVGGQAEQARQSAAEDKANQSEQLREQAKERLEKLADEVNQKLDDRLKIRFDQDEETGIDFFQLIEQKSGDIIRQVPSKEVLEVIANNREITNLLFNEQA